LYERQLENSKRKFDVAVFRKIDKVVVFNVYVDYLFWEIIYSYICIAIMRSQMVVVRCSCEL